MAYTRQATKSDVEDFDRAKKLAIPREEAISLAQADKLLYEGSEYKDPEDYVALKTKDGRQVGHWPGY